MSNDDEMSQTQQKYSTYSLAALLYLLVGDDDDGDGDSVAI